MAVAAVKELGISIEGFRAKTFNVHPDIKNGQRSLDTSARSVVIPVADVKRLTAEAKLPTFLVGTPIGNPEIHPLRRTQGFLPDHHTGAPIMSPEPQVSEFSLTLAALENSAMSGVRNENWSVPPSSQSTEKTNATVFDTTGGSWHIDRESYGEARTDAQTSSLLGGTKLSLTYTDSHGNIRRFSADIPCKGRGNVTYSEIRDGKEITFVNGSHRVEAAKLASDFAGLGPDKVILVKNEISRTKEVWAENPHISRDVVEKLLLGNEKFGKPVHQAGDVFVKGLHPRPNPNYASRVSEWGTLTK